MGIHRLNFFPLGNADCCRIDLDSGKQILIDYAAMRDAADKGDLRIDLPGVLRKDLEGCKRDYYDVVGFSHLDDDHIRGASNFFYLEHAEKYQENVDGKVRIKIRELWVPAAVITEEGCTDEDRIIRQEARHRLKRGSGIRVFSRPEALKDWLESEGLSIEARQSLISDAGQLIPGYRAELDGVEFFVHSPFACRTDDGTYVERNDGCLVLHATFMVDGVKTRLFLGADIRHEPFSEIIRITCSKNRLERLESDIVKIPHHSSYLSLSPEQGESKTKPTEEIAYFYEKQLMFRAKLISTSWGIPSDDSSCQPPHRQAARYYDDSAAAQGGEFLVTMEHPSKENPRPLVIEITGSKSSIAKPFLGGASAAVTQRPPRAGHGF
jgi:hypothetical protein